jgi:3-oxoacyl-[acyl-carrier-protein] synthase-1
MKRNGKKNDIVITGLGLVTSVGHDVKTACAALRADIRRPKTLTNFCTDAKPGDGGPEDRLVTGYPAFEGDPDEAESRIVFMLAEAFRDMARMSGLRPDTASKLPFYLALPEVSRGILTDEALETFRAESAGDLPWTPDDLNTVRTGHAGMIELLSDVVESMRQGKMDRAVIAGADTLINFKDLVRSYRQNRLMTPGTVLGIIPGEVASAILVETRSAAAKRGARIGAVVAGSAVSDEPSTVLSGQPSSGRGLADAVRALAEKNAVEPFVVESVISDLFGDAYRFEELAILRTRVLNRIEGPKNLIWPARNIGDTGAASSGVSIALAVRNMIRTAHAPRGWRAPPAVPGNAMILSSSDEGLRGALFLRPEDDNDHAVTRAVDI